jgi:hypothetical protein
VLVAPIVLNAGRTPGVSNLVVADLLAAHPDADAVEIVLSFAAGGVSGRAGGESLHRHLTSAGHHGMAVIPFPAPVGSTRCLRSPSLTTAGSATLPAGGRWRRMPASARGRSIAPCSASTPCA